MIRIFNHLRKDYPDCLANPMTQDDLDELKDAFSKRNFALPKNDDFWLEYFIHDGFAFNGCLLFSVGIDALWEPEFSLSDLLEENIDFHAAYEHYESYSQNLILLGKNDEDLILYNTETEVFSLAAREDLMPYYESKDRAFIMAKAIYSDIENFRES